jgi:hypothetical protein
VRIKAREGARVDSETRRNAVRTVRVEQVRTRPAKVCEPGYANGGQTNECDRGGTTSVWVVEMSIKCKSIETDRESNRTVEYEMPKSNKTNRERWRTIRSGWPK